MGRTQILKQGQHFIKFVTGNFEIRITYQPKILPTSKKYES